ncbi:transporter substrate-binding domain-containing protein [uncultured Ruthenibacterium sp.]|uniref:transporter substrate-binding domain-containing protein n=1 Tax=uncultured Ruthenibacterium sp. TaxID=1905347 RepID=UPI00349EB66F
MKKIAALLMGLTMALSLAACGGEPTVNSDVSLGTEASSAVSSSTADSTSAAQGNVADHTVEAIQERGKLIVATESQYAPFEFKDVEGNIVGLDPSIMQALADDLGVELEIMDIAFDGVVPAVQSGAADIALAGLSATEDRKQSIDFSDLYYEGGQVLLVPQGMEDAYTQISDLDGKTISTQKGTIQQTLLEEQFPNATANLLPQFPAAVMELVAGNCDAVMIDAVSAEQYVKNYEGIGISSLSIEADESGFCAGIMKGNTSLQEYLNEKIAEYKENGKISEWYVEATEKASELGIE